MSAERSTPSRPPSADDAMKLAAQWWYWQRHDDHNGRPDAVLPFHLVDLAAYVEELEAKLK